MRLSQNFEQLYKLCWILFLGKCSYPRQSKILLLRINKGKSVRRAFVQHSCIRKIAKLSEYFKHLVAKSDCRDFLQPNVEHSSPSVKYLGSLLKFFEWKQYFRSIVCCVADCCIDKSQTSYEQGFKTWILRKSLIDDFYTQAFALFV